MFRSRKTTLRYHRALNYRTAEDDIAHCPFCSLDDRTIFADTSTMQVVANKYPYEFWDNREVLDHLLLTPKRHVLTLDELTKEEKVEAIHLMAEYEAAGYNVYWRSQDNATRSVPHQHTHLIKLRNKRTNFLLYVRKPYITWKF